MSDSARLIDFEGHKKAIEDIFVYLNSPDPVNRVLLTGISGTGKSFIAYNISDRWNSFSDNNIAIYLSGDNAYSQRKYHPFVTALTLLKRDEHFIKTLTNSVVELSKGIPFAGDFISYLVETLGKSKESQQQQSLRYLNDMEKALIHDFDTLFRDRNLLIVVDNLHWLDQQSLYFLQLILESSLYYQYTAFDKIKFLLVATDDQNIVAEKEFKEIISGQRFLQVKTNPVQQDEYASVLLKFGFKGTLTSSLIKTLYSFTGSHLVLIKKLAEYLASKHPIGILDINLFGEKDDPSYSFIETLLLYKLESLGASGKQIISLLEFASVIGITFSKDELLCISHEKEEQLEKIIEVAKEAQLISGEQSNQKFIHEILRYFFLNRLQERKFSYYKSFSYCLNKLRPSDYATRAGYLFEAGEVSEANIVYILGALKDVREGIITVQENISRINSFESEFNLPVFFSSMTAAYDQYLKTHYSGALGILEKIEDWLPKSLLAEKYYLMALCLSKTMFREDLEKAKTCLMGWDDLRLEEPEIWIRTTTTAMMVNINLYHYEEAKAIEKKIIFFLSERIKFDHVANYNLNIIRRNSTAAHINEIACLRTQQSVDYFIKELQHTGPTYPVQLYYSLINNAANLIIAGEYMGAFENAGKALNLISLLPHVNFPEPQIAANNYILAGVFLESITMPVALKMFEIISPYKDFVADEILIRNNYAVVLIHNDEIEKAFLILSELEKLCTGKNIDPFYSYIIAVNLTGLKFVKGMRPEFELAWKQLEDKLPDIPDKQFLQKRYSLYTLHVSKIERSWKTWDTYLINNFPDVIGKAWKFYAKGFLLSDIQLWYES